MIKMLRPVTRFSRRTLPQLVSRAGQRHERRNISFAPPSRKPRTWKGTFFRWGLAAGGVYWYATSDIHLFDQQANEHGHIGPAVIEIPDEAKLPTIDEITLARKERQLATLDGPAPESSDEPNSQVAGTGSPLPSAGGSEAGTAEALEEEAESQGAFNEETGEINWDCPCLGGMAHGPCGEQFREAFSCFVYSKEEPKGVDCIDKFKTMQNCFREHPDVYGAELTDDPDDEFDEDAPTPLDTEAPAPAANTEAAAKAAAVPEKKSKAASEKKSKAAASAATAKSEKTAISAPDSSLGQDLKEAETSDTRDAKAAPRRTSERQGEEAVNVDVVSRTLHEAEGLKKE